MMTDTQSPAAPPVSPTPVTDRRSVTMWWVAAFFVVAVLIGALAVVFLGRNNSGGAPETPSTAPPAACAVSGGTQTVPTTTPAGIEWRVSASKVVLPYSTTAGPLTEQGPLARCYSHDPVGAVLAASQIYARSFGNSNRTEAAAVVREQFVAGPRRDELLTSLAQPTDAPEQIQWRAFKYLTYSTDEATVVMALESTAGVQVVGIPVTLSWQDDDWKYNVEKFNPPYELDTSELTTFVQWSGIR